MNITIKLSASIEELDKAARRIAYICEDLKTIHPDIMINVEVDISASALPL